MKEIYLDNAAGTLVDRRVVREVVRGMTLVGNPSAFNDPGREAFEELQKARQVVARFLGAHADEIVVTSSGSEANTLALLGAARGSGIKSGRVITVATEHKSVLEPVRTLGSEGFSIVILPVDTEGFVSLTELEKNMSRSTMLVSVMYANNEIGTIQPVVAIGKVIKEFRKKNKSPFPLFHVDACQAAAYLPMDVNRLGADLVSFNGSKLHGPRGVGVLYVRKGLKIAPVVLGGGQENGLRAGTENLPAILGLAKALLLIKPAESEKIARLRDLTIAGILKVLPDAKLNGPTGDERLSNNINISIPGVHSEQLLLELDKHGIAAGSGSACTARSIEPSHVLRAIGNEFRYLDGALRLSLSRDTKKADIDYLLRILPEVVTTLRQRYGTSKKSS